MTSPCQPTMSPSSSKGAPTPPQQQHIQPSTSTPPNVLGDNTARRHSNQNSSRNSPNPRNMQSQRRSNKPHRRPRLQEDDDSIAEHNVIRAGGSRRGQTSITHLMSFALPPRPLGPNSYSNRFSRRNQTWGIGSGYHVTDKSKYIHANYRFIVDPRENYHEQMVDSDTHLDWDQVLQVLASYTEDTTCPICLSKPTAPRIAKCGHIFCLPCIIRYIHAVDDERQIPERKRRWKPCPICFDSIFMHELKSVRWTYIEQTQEPKEGNDVVLRLLMRKANSMLALPRDDASHLLADTDAPWYFAAEVLDFANVIKGSEAYMRNQYDHEIQALRIQEKEDELMFGEESIWSQKAVATILDLKEKLKSILEADSAIQTVTNSRSSMTDIGDTGFYYFYQAPQYSFLSPLDIRILKATFGDFSSFPSTLLPRVEHVITGNIVDEDIRRRAKYLSHLPLGREINFLECDWTGIVPEPLLARFSNEIEKRRKRNQDKATREEKARLRAEQSEDKKLYGGRRQRNSSFKELDTETLLREDDFAPSLPVDFVSSSSLAHLASSTDGKTLSIGSSASPSASPPGPVTVWGTPAVASSSPLTTTVEEHIPMSEDDGWLQNWESDLIADKALIDQAKSISLSDGTHSMTSGAAGDGLKKKKKKQKITLMSTNGKRAA